MFPFADGVPLRPTFKEGRCGPRYFPSVPYNDPGPDPGRQRDREPNTRIRLMAPRERSGRHR
ncbi:MAG: hypothetical protein M5U19_17550 [Microthrixaceae bacterium]|nr:hypothetical protein [Microthrixaceae bacterium]